MKNHSSLDTQELRKFDEKKELFSSYKFNILNQESKKKQIRIVK